MFDALSPDQVQLVDRLAGLLRVDSGPDESCSADAAEAAIERIYATIGLDAPHVVWCDGPFQLAVMPILLQLIIFQPDETQLSKLSQKFGLAVTRTAKATMESSARTTIGTGFGRSSLSDSNERNPKTVGSRRILPAP
jgi:hypothetical protein